jgi:hypothetical protein
MENMAVRMQNVIGQRGACEKRCLEFKGLIKAMEDEVGVKNACNTNFAGVIPTG